MAALDRTMASTTAVGIRCLFIESLQSQVRQRQQALPQSVQFPAK
jgi:hypothetical protein